MKAHKPIAVIICLSLCMMPTILSAVEDEMDVDSFTLPKIDEIIKVILWIS